MSGVAPANQTKERSVHELFAWGIPEQKFNVNRACFPKEKHQNSQKCPVFARVVGELRAADPSNVQGPVKQNASPGEQSEAPR